MGLPTLDSAYYDESYYELHLKRLRANDRFTRVKIGRMRALLVPRPGEVIADLGCGVGTIMVALEKSGVRSIGIDYSSTSLRLTRRAIAEFAPGSVFRGLCSDGQCLGLSSESVDGVTAIDFTEHIDDGFLKNVCAEVHRVLKPGGRFVIYTPCRTHLFELLKEHSIILKKDHSHIGLRVMGEYVGFLKGAGFRIDKAFHEATHLPGYGMVEKVIMQIPIMGDLAKRRICIRATKPRAISPKQRGQV